MSEILGIDVDEVVARGLNAWADHVLGKIIDYTPMDTGTLRKSISWIPATSEDLAVTFISSGSIAVSSNDKSSYNKYVHDGSNNKNWTTPGTGHLFLVLPTIKEDHLKQKFILEALKGLVK